MTPILLVNAKWRISPRYSGVQRYAEGLAGAIEASDLTASFAVPPSQGKVRSRYWEQRTLPRLARQFPTLLCPANSAPTKLDPGVRLLAVIHCLRFRFHPRDYSPAFVRWYEHCIPRIIDRADTVFTVSDAQRDEIESVYPGSIGKVELLPPGLDPEFHPDHKRDQSAPAPEYLIALSTSSPSKNLRTLLNAYALNPGLPPLVLLGVSSSEADVICPEHIRPRIRALGHIQDRRKAAALIAHARLLLAPSIYESFGLPCLEAMGCGTPVLASDIPAHREVCAEAATFVEPLSSEAWASEIDRVLGDQLGMDVMRSRGLSRSGEFRWDQRVETLRTVLESSQPVR